MCKFPCINFHVLIFIHLGLVRWVKRDHRTTGGYIFAGVCLFNFRKVGGGGIPYQVCEWGEYPIPGVGGGVPCPRSGGTPSQVLVGEYTPGQVWIVGSTRAPPWPGLDGGGYPPTH